MMHLLVHAAIARSVVWALLCSVWYLCFAARGFTLASTALLETFEHTGQVLYVEKVLKRRSDHLTVFHQCLNHLSNEPFDTACYCMFQARMEADELTWLEIVESISLQLILNRRCDELLGLDQALHL